MAVIQLAGLLHHEQTPPAFPLESRPAYSGYNALVVRSGQGLRLRLNSYFPPFKRGQAFTFGTGRFCIQFLRCFLFCAYLASLFNN